MTIPNTNKLDKLTGPILFSCYPHGVPQAQHQNMAGATYLVSKESLDAGQYKWEEVIGPPAVSTTTREIFDSIKADTVVIKIDVEGHECKALLPEILDQSTGKFVPYIFMEVR